MGAVIPPRVVGQMIHQQFMGYTMFVIDADAHVMETDAAWAHLEKEFYARRPVPVVFPEDTSLTVFNAAWLIDEKVRLFGASPPIGTRSLVKKYTMPSQTLESVAARLGDMDKRRIDMQVVHTTFGLLNICEDPVLEGALMRSYNTFMAEKCSQSGGRLKYNALVPFRDPDAATAEIRRVASMGGACAVFMRGLEWDSPVSDPAFYPIYAEAERQNLAIAMHLGAGSPKMRTVFEYQKRIPGEEPFWPPRSKRLIGPMTVQFGFYSLMESPVSIDFPKLRWAFLEAAGAEWMIGAIGAMERAGKFNARKMLEDGRVFICAEPTEDLQYLANKFGSDCLVIGSDMPHQDEAAHENLVDEFEARSDLPAALMEKLLWKNAARLYDLDPASVKKQALPA